MVRDQSHEFTRRELMTMLGATGAAGLAGCPALSGNGDGGDGTADGTPNAEINFWSKEVQAPRTELISGIAQDFNQNSAGTVNPIFISQSNLATQLTSAISSNTVPTVLQGFSQTVQQLATEDLVATERVGNVIDAIGRDDFRQGPLDFFATGDGGHMGIPIDGWATSMWYRQSEFEERGLEPPNTWEATLEAAEEFHDPDNNVYGIGIATAQNVYMRQCLAHFGQANGVQVFDADGNIAFDSEETVEALDYYGRLSQYTAPGDINFTGTRQNYQNGRSHMILWSPYIIDDILNQVGQSLVDDTGVTRYMENTQKATWGVINGITISSLSSADEQAIGEDFAESLMTGENYIDWLHMAPGGKNPVRESVAQDEAYQDNEVLNAWGSKVEDISAALNNARNWAVVDGQTYAGFGAITAQQLIAQAGARAVEGDDPETIASETADEMRSALE